MKTKNGNGKKSGVGNGNDNGIVSMKGFIVTPPSQHQVGTEDVKHPGRKNLILRDNGFPETVRSKKQRHSNLFSPDLSEWDVLTQFLGVDSEESSITLVRTRLMEFIYGMGRTYTVEPIDSGE